MSKVIKYEPKKENADYRIEVYKATEEDSCKLCENTKDVFAIEFIRANKSVDRLMLCSDCMELVGTAILHGEEDVVKASNEKVDPFRRLD